MTSISGHWMHFVLKKCQTVAGISMTSEFHDFLDLIFGGFLPFGITVLQRGTLCSAIAQLLVARWQKVSFSWSRSGL